MTTASPHTGIHALLLARLAARGSAPVLFGNPRCARQEWTSAELARAVVEFAAGLESLGVKRGDRVAILADNHDLWLVADLAVLALGAADVPRAADASTEEIAFVVAHSESTFVIAEDAELWERVREAIRANGPLPPAVILKGAATAGAHTYESVATRGAERLRRKDSAIGPLGSAVERSQLATIVYTSGTTGNPKGVMLTHGNILHNIETLPELVAFSERDSYLSFLPSWHTFERTFTYCIVAAGARIHYTTKAALRKDLARVRPTLVAGVPRLWETLASNVIDKIHKLPGLKRRLIETALKASARHIDALRRRRGWLLDKDWRIIHPSPLGILVDLATLPLLWPLHRLADTLIYRKLRESLGGNIRFLVSGGGALPAHVDEFINRAGVCLLNGYGLTETAPVVSVRLPQRNVLLTAGQPLAETEFRVMDDEGRVDLGTRKKGVLWIRGPQVMKGYFKNPAATDKVLRDGWFNSGDLAILTDQQDVVISGRVKDTLVLRGGENVEPENIEAEIVRSPLIADAVVVGHAQKHLGALIVPNAEALAASVPGLPKHPDATAVMTPAIQKLLHAEITRLVGADRGFRIFERVPKIALIAEPFSVEAGTLTPTLKKRRHVIEERYAAEIRGLFTGGESDV